MIHPQIATRECPSHESLNQRMRFGMHELLTAMLLSSIAFASPPAVGWNAAVCMTGAALTLVMGWGSIALAASIAALFMACDEPNAAMATTVCSFVLMTIVFGPLVVHRLSKVLTRRPASAPLGEENESQF